MWLRTAIFTGHSGGHLFPATAFVESLRQKFPEVWVGLVTSVKARPFVEGLPQGLFDQVDYFPEFPFSLKFHWRTVIHLLQFFQSFVLALLYLRRHQIHFCAGFGSYISYPGIMTAGFLKIPTLIHEQNLIPGKATRLLARHADVVAVSFSGTFEKEGLRKRVVTGLPIRRRFTRLTGPEPIRGDGDLFRILVAGGSQGAKRLNAIILESFSRLLPEEKKKVAVTHLTGKQDFEAVSKKYKSLAVKHEVFPFFDAMEQLYQKADMAITRAGANTLFELALFGLPSIVVPYPHAEAHQRANAESFSRQGAVLVEDESSLTPDKLVEQIRLLRDNPVRRLAMKGAARAASCRGAGDALVDAAANLLERKSHASY